MRILPIAIVFVSCVLLCGYDEPRLEGALNAQEAQAAPVPAPPETTPGEAAVEETVPKVRLDPKKGFGQLLHPSVQDRIGLTDAQRLEVQRLMVERSQAMGATALEDLAAQEKIIAESDKKLEAILTPEQQRIWPKVFEQRLLLVNWNNHPWDHALRWFASQVGKELTMEAPPPGTITYTSPGRVTPNEVLDKINSRLLYRGYTLVNNENNLILFNLKMRPSPLTLEYLPKVDEQTLSNHGNFEFVALTFPLEYRDVAVVKAQMQPFQGSYCRIIDMTGNSLMMIDTVYNLKSMLAVGKAVANPVPKPPEKPAPPPAPPESKWEFYTITRNDIEKVQEILTKYANVNGFREGDTLYYLVPEEQHVNIRKLIDLLERGSTERPKAILDVYSMEGLTDTSPQTLYRKAVMRAYGYQIDPSVGFGTAIVELIKKLAPDADVAANQVSNKLAVFAIPEDHEKIKDLFEKLQGSPSPEFTPVVKIYSYKGNTRRMRLSEEVSEMIQKLVPGIQYHSYDPRKSQLLVVGLEREHAIIEQALKEFETQSLPDEEKVLETYPLTATQMTLFGRLFDQVRRLPELRDILELHDSRQNHVTIWATPTQQEKVKSIIQEITKSEVAPAYRQQVTDGEAAPTDAVPADGNLSNYAVVPLKNTYYYAVQQIIVNTVPGLTVTPDPRANSLVIYSSSAQRVEQAKQILEQMDASVGTDVRFFPFAKELSQDLRQTFPSVAPRVRTVWDKKNMRLLAYGPKNEVAELAKVIDMHTQTETDSPETFRTVSVLRDLPNELLDFVRQSFPRAQINFNRDAKQITVTAPDSEHVAIAKMILEAVQTLPPEEQTQFYPLDQPVTDHFITLIREAVKPVGNIGEIKKDDKNPKILIVRARPHVQEKVKELLANRETLLPSVEPNQLHSFSVTQETRKRFDAVRDEFVKQNGDFRVLNEDRKDILSVWATPTQIQLLEEFLSQLSKERATELAEKQIFHSLKHVDLDFVKTMFEDIYPGTKINEDKIGGRIIVRVRPEYYEGAKEFLEKLDSRDPDQLRRYPKAYEIEGLNTFNAIGQYFGPTTAIQDIEKLVPQAKVRYDYYTTQLIVWGTDEEHKIVGETLRSVQKEDDRIKRFERYPLQRAQPHVIIGMINRLYPYLTSIQMDYATNSIIVEGGKHQLQMIQKLIDKLDPSEPGPNDPIVRFYQLKSKPEPSLITTLQGLVPTAQIVPDVDAKQLMIICRPSEHRVLERNIQSILETFTQPEEPMLFIYPVSGEQRKQFQTFITAAQSELKDITILPETRADQMFILARPTEHDLISAVLLQIKTSTESEFEMKIRPFQLVFLDPEIAQDILKEYHPEVKIIHDAKGNRLLVCGTQQNLDKVAETLKTVDKTQIDDTQPQFDVFTIDGVRFEQYYMRRFVVGQLMELLQQIAPNAKFFPGSDYYRIIAWGTPEELARIRAAMEKIGYSNDPKDQPQAKVFELKAVDASIVDTILKPMVPDAFISVDDTTGKIVVFAREKDMNNIVATIEHLERNVDTRVPNTYDITGTKAEIVLEAIKNVYPGLKITEDPANNRLMIWATPEEHVRIGELVEQMNKEPVGDMFEKFSVYPITRMNYTSVINMMTELFPEAKTFGDVTSDKITIKARGKQHKEIKELLESLQEKDEKFRTKMTIYPISTCDPVTIEVLLQSLLQYGKSLSPQDVKNGVRGMGNQYMYYYYDYDRYEYMGYNPQAAAQMQREGRAYYRVDAKSRVAIVVANEEDQKRVNDAIEAIVSLSESEQKPVAKRFTLNDLYPITILETLQQVAPSVQILPTYNRWSGDGNLNDFIAFGPEPELAKIDKFVEEINASGPSGNRREMLVLTLPAGTKSSRQRIIQMLTYLYPPQDAASQPALGPEPNQIVMLSPKHLHEQIQKLVDDVCKPLPEGQQAEYKSYPLSHIEMRDALRWLREICPNATISQDTAPKIDPYTGRPLPIRTLMVLATPIEHAEIAKALSVLDQEHPDLNAPFPRVYTIHKKNAMTFFRLLRQIVPKSQFMAGENPQDLVAYASSEEHEKIKKFVDELNGQGDSGGTMQFNVVNIPQGTRYNRTSLIAWLEGVFPELYPWPGWEPHQILVFGYEYQREKAQALVDKACSPAPEDQQTSSKVYPLKNISDVNAMIWLRQICPNATVTTDRRVDTINGLAIVVRATPMEHALIEKTLADLDVDLPESVRPVPRHYTLEDITPGTYYSVFSAIYYAFSSEIITIIPSDPARSVILVFAREDVHAKIDAFLKKHIEELDSRKEQLQVYQLTSTNYYKIFPILQRLVSPTTTITAGNVPDVLYVYGSPKDQKIVAETIQKIETAALKRTEMDGEGVTPGLKFYRIASRDAFSLYFMLQQQFTGAVIYPTSQEMIVAWASPNDHEQIAKIVDAAAEAFPEQVYKTYFFKHVPLGNAHVMLSHLFPPTQASFTTRPDTGDLIVLATPEHQERIARCIEEIDIERPKDVEPYAVAYDLNELPLTTIWYQVCPHFMRAVPSCTILPTPVSTQLVVYCRESEHKKIAQIIEEMLKTNPLTQMRMRNYTLKTTTAGQAYQLLVYMFPAPNVQFGFSPSDRHLIMARANEKDHERIKDAIDAMNQTDPNQAVPKSYRFKRASIMVASYAINTVFPTALIVPDYSAEMLVITATPEQHERIDAMVKEYDAIDPETQSTMRVHNTGNVNIANLQVALNVLYARNPSFQAVADPYNRTLTVHATPQQQTFVADLIRQIQDGGLADPSLTLKVFPLQNRDIITLRYLIQNMFSKRGVNIDLTPDYSSNSLVALARPEELEIMQQIMDATKQPDKIVDIFELEKVDPYSIMMAVGQIFAEESYSQRPRITSDDQNTIFVRGTQEQVDRIREVLIQMGETQLLNKARHSIPTDSTMTPPAPNPQPPTPNEGVLSGETGAVRTIRVDGVKDEKLDAALKRIEEDAKSKGTTLIIREPQEPVIQEKQEKNNPETVSPDPSDEEKSVRLFREEKNAIAFFQIAPIPETQSPARDDESSTPEKYVYVIKNPDGTLTLMSTDTQELNEVEAQLKQLTEEPKKSRIFASGRDYTIYMVWEVSPNIVLQRLRAQLQHKLAPAGQTSQYGQFGTYNMYNRFGGYGMTPQRRRTLQLDIEPTMNAIIVRGTKIEREEVGQLIEELDKAQLKQEVLPKKPVNVYIHNLEASEVMQEILAVYGTTLQRIRQPNGEIARIMLKRTSNSIDIFAPEPLATQLKEYAEEVDRDFPTKQAEKIHVIRPGKTNSATIDDAIKAIQQSSMQRYRLNNPNIYNPYMYPYSNYRGY